MTEEQKTVNQRIDGILKQLPGFEESITPELEPRLGEVNKSLYLLRYELAEKYEQISEEEARIAKERLKGT